jgi:hypothetical protein
MGRPIFVDDSEVAVLLEKSVVGLRYVMGLDKDDLRNYDRVHGIIDLLERASACREFGLRGVESDRLRIKIRSHVALWQIHLS